MMIINSATPRKGSHNRCVFCQVAACTEVGCGGFTQPVFGDAEVETPVPRLLLSTSDAVQIADCDKHENHTLSRSGSVVDLAYSSHDNRVYWIDDNNHLITSKLYKPEKTKVCSIKTFTVLYLSENYINIISE